MKLIWTQVAHVDRKKIREYISQDNPSAAFSSPKRGSGYPIWQRICAIIYAF